MTKLRMRPSARDRGLIDDEFEHGQVSGDASGGHLLDAELPLPSGTASGSRYAWLVGTHWDNTPGVAATLCAHTPGTLAIWADPDMPDEAVHGRYGYEFGYNAWREGRLGES